MPRRARARLAAADHEVANVEVEVRRLAGPLRDLVDVEVERPRRRRVQLHLERGLLACFADRRGLERDVGGLDVTARLQEAAELHMLDEAGASALLVDHEGRRSEVSGRLVAGQRLRELLGEPKHGAPVRLLTRVAGDVRLQQPYERLPPVHSYCSACRTFSRAARRAGKIAASMPDDDRHDREDDQRGDGQRELDEVDPHDEQPAEHDAERDPERPTDQRGDHALVPDHAPHLASRHADRTQHADLARPLEHGQDERVDDAEEADDHRQREQHVEDVQDRAEPADLVVDELLARLHLRVREAPSASRRARPGSLRSLRRARGRTCRGCADSRCGRPTPSGRW